MKRKQKIAVVTGASRGIGAATAALLSKAGFRVAMTGRDLGRLQKAARKVRGERAIFPADLLDASSVKALVDRVERELGTPDVLVNVAGAWHDESARYQGPHLEATPLERIDEVLGVGVLGLFRVVRGFLPAMVAARRGHVIQIGCGFAGPHEAKGWLHYYVANQAIAAFTRGLAAELREPRIAVNCVAPWFVATEYVKKFYPNDAATALRPERVAQAILGLVEGPFSHDTSGQVIELRSEADV